jgi:hypothetical protein
MDLCILGLIDLPTSGFPESSQGPIYDLMLAFVYLPLVFCHLRKTQEKKAQKVDLKEKN